MSEVAGIMAAKRTPDLLPLRLPKRLRARDARDRLRAGGRGTVRVTVCCIFRHVLFLGFWLPFLRVGRGMATPFYVFSMLNQLA